MTTTTTDPPAPSATPTGRPGDPAALIGIDSACRTLRLPTIRARVTDMIAVAQREQLSYPSFLAEALLAECDDRDQRRRARRVHDAAFPRSKRLEAFNHAANPATIATLATGTWIATGSPVCLIGDSGTGKTHLLIGLGIAGAEAGYRVRYVLTSRLVNELAEADNDRTLTKVIARYGRVDLLCLDELGYLALDRRGAELLFQVLTEREERNAIAVASNEPFSSWTKTFTDPRLCTAIVDRLTSTVTSSRPAPPATASPTPKPSGHLMTGPAPRRWGQNKPSLRGQISLTKPMRSRLRLRPRGRG